VNSVSTAVEAAQRWLRNFPNDAIITPVRLEMLGGVLNRDHLIWTEAFLNEFDLMDDGKVLLEDWREAERLARRVPSIFRPRGALDCLIRAICLRLHAELYTDDTGMP